MISESAGTSKLKRKPSDITFGSNYVYSMPSLKIGKRNHDDKMPIVRTIKSDVNLAEGGSYYNSISDQCILDKDFGEDAETAQRERRVFMASDDENSNFGSRDKAMVPVQLLQGNKDIDLTLCSIKGTEQDGLPVQISLNSDINFAVPPVSLSSTDQSVSRPDLVADSQDHSYPKYDYGSDPESSSDPVRNMWVTTKADKAQLRNSGHTWKTGKFTQDEVDLLKKNIDRYCKEHGIEDARQIIYNASKEERPKFYPTIAAGLNRTVFQVYRRVKRMYDSQNYKGKYSPEEVVKLKDLHAKYGKDWSLIGQEMGRSSDSVKDRCRLIIGNEKNPGKWSADEELELARAVYATTGVKEGTSVTSNICWSTVAQEVGTRTEKQCRAKWLNYLNWKMSNGEKWTKTEDVVLLERIAASGAHTEQEIDWEFISSGWKSSRSPQWLRIKWWSLKQFYLGDIPDASTISLGDLLEELSKLIVKQISTCDHSKRVRKPALELQTDKFLTKEPTKKTIKPKIDKKIAIKPRLSKQTKPASFMYVDNANSNTVAPQENAQNVVLLTDSNGDVHGRIILDKDAIENVMLTQTDQAEDSEHTVDIAQSSDIFSSHDQEEVDTSQTSEDYLSLNATLQLTPTSAPGVYLVQNSDSNNPLMLVLSEDINSVDFTPEVLSYINNASSRTNIVTLSSSTDDDIIGNLEESHPATPSQSEDDDMTSWHHSDVITTSDALVYQETINDDSKNPILGSAIHEVVTESNDNAEDSCFIQSSSPLQGTLLQGTDLPTSSL